MTKETAEKEPKKGDNVKSGGKVSSSTNWMSELNRGGRGRRGSAVVHPMEERGN